MTDMINLARVCIPSPEYNTGKEVFSTIQRGSLDGVLFELLDNAPNNDDLSRYREFYEIVDGVPPPFSSRTLKDSFAASSYSFPKSRSAGKRK